MQESHVDSQNIGSAAEDEQAEFERGLESILGPMREQGASQQQLEEVASRAKEFFLSRKTSSNVDSTREQEPSQEAVSQEPSSDLIDLPTHISSASFTTSLPNNETTTATEPPYPPTFEQIAEMIANGTPIPGIREIPDKLNEETPTEARVAKQQGAGLKPWERNTTAEASNIS